MLLRTASGPTASERMRAQTVYAVDATMKLVASNTTLLLEVVAGGPDHWRRGFLAETLGLAVNAHVADSMFAFFCRQVEQRWGGVRAGDLLDALEVDVVKPPTPREIEEAWLVESASSDEGRRYFYGRDGHPEQLVRQWAAEAARAS